MTAAPRDARRRRLLTAICSLLLAPPPSAASTARTPRPDPLATLLVAPPSAAGPAGTVPTTAASARPPVPRGGGIPHPTAPRPPHPTRPKPPPDLPRGAQLPPTPMDGAAPTFRRNAAAPRPQRAPRPGPGAIPAFAAPVTAPLVRRFGAPTPDGHASGIAYATPPNAPVTAPCPGRIAFAGPFRSYGSVLILACDGGDSAVLAGLGRTDAPLGTVLPRGAPVGRMPGTASTLTVQLRRDGVPVDPLAPPPPPKHPPSHPPRLTRARPTGIAKPAPHSRKPP